MAAVETETLTITRAHANSLLDSANVNQKAYLVLVFGAEQLFNIRYYVGEQFELTIEGDESVNVILTLIKAGEYAFINLATGLTVGGSLVAVGKSYLLDSDIILMVGESYTLNRA